MAESIYRRIRIFLRSLLGRGRLQSNLDEEIKLHLEELTDELIEQGIPKDVARKKALKRFGSVERIKDDTRESWGLQKLMDILKDFKFGLRLCTKHLSSSILALIVLSVGIGIFGILFTASTKLLETGSGEELDERQLFIQWELGLANGGQVSVQDFNVLNEEVDSLENLIGIELARFDFSLASKKEEIKTYTGVITTTVF